MGLRSWLNQRPSGNPPTQHAPTPQRVPEVYVPSAPGDARYPLVAPAASVAVPAPPAYQEPVVPTPGPHLATDPRWQVPGASTTSWAVWVPPGQAVQLPFALVNGGGVYVGPGLTAAQAAYQREPALIDPTLPVNFRQPDWNGDCLKYWPSYYELTPEGRAAYLSWLSWGRDTPDMPVGYVFLYVYGLERRALVDAARSSVAHAELPWILGELDRLLAIYRPASSSFSGYVSQFASLLRFLVHGAPSDPPTEVTHSWELPLDVKVGLGSLVSAGRPLPPEWALTWVLAHPDVHFRTPSIRCPDEFAELFFIRYRAKYGDGLVVHPSKTALSLSYRPAPHGVPNVTIPLNGVCDVGRLTAPVRELSALGAECAAALDSYSRWLGRHPEGRGSLPALALLPPDLLDGRPDGPGLLTLTAWCDEVLDEQDHAVSDATGLIDQWPGAPAKLTKAESEELARLLEIKGYGIEPDTRYGGSPLHPGPLVVFRLPSEHLDPGDDHWAQVSPCLQLAGSIVATLHPDEQALDTIAASLSQELILPANAQSRVRARMAWAASARKAPPVAKRTFDSLDQPTREGYGLLLINLAARFSQLGPSQITALTGAYSTLGLAPASVYSLIHDRATTPPAADLITVRPARPGPPGESVPPPSPGVSAAASSTHVTLDPDVIARRRADSAEAAALLGSVFVDDDTPAPGPEAKTGGVLAELLRQLAAQPMWTRPEFDTLAASLGVLPNGALESLNDAAFEACGEALIEGSDNLEVNPDVLQELL